MSKPPFLMRGPLSNAVFIVTKYRERDDRTVIEEKFDVTDQFNRLVNEADQ